MAIDSALQSSRKIILTADINMETKAFDDSVKNAVKRWRFQKIEKGKAIVEIPFTFSM